jgi:Type ISP C-terminal specificity domain
VYRTLCVASLSTPGVIGISVVSSVVSYEAGRGARLVGDGGFAPVRSEVWDYIVGGKNFVRSWFNYRKKDPAVSRTTRWTWSTPKHGSRSGPPSRSTSSPSSRTWPNCSPDRKISPPA